MWLEVARSFLPEVARGGLGLPRAVARGGQLWLEVARAGLRWQEEVAKGG
jgi:hypothetical protein